MATVPGTVAFDLQDQIFIRDGKGAHHPLVRARTPNGFPWIPNDGYNLTVVGGWNYTANDCGSDGNVHGPNCGAVLPSPPVLTRCEPAPPPPPPPPGRPTPPVGGCVAVPNTTLINGVVPLPVPVITATAAACSLLCKATPCCNG